MGVVIFVLSVVRVVGGVPLWVVCVFDDVRLGAVYEFFSSSILFLMPFMLI